ncbi:MAG TPA: LysM domain-containing protein [Acidimicrobiales bacterium]|nr:LysM domain-containing protein [Acidimicrobiales bacterium]
MAALFPIPYDVDYDESVPGRRTVIPFDRGGLRRRGIDRRRAIRRRNAGFVVAAVSLVVVTLLALGAVFAVIDALSQPPSVTPVPVAAVAEVGSSNVVVVQSGDTLTSIARDLQPNGDISALVDRLAAQHGPAPLQPGERLLVGSTT